MNTEIKSELKPNKISEQVVQNLLLVMPDWHAKLVRPFKEQLSGEMSLETYYCLETLKAQGKMSMSEMAQQLKVPKQQVTKLVDNLSRHKFVERVQNESDRRVTWLCLTPRAEEYLDTYYLKNTAFLTALEEQLSQEEMERLNEAMGILWEILPKMR